MDKRIINLANWLSKHYYEYVPDILIEKASEKYGIKRAYLILILIALRELHQSFPDKPASWYQRAIIRLLMGVERTGKKSWRVKGIKELGDMYEIYNVWLSKDGKYQCDCYYRQWGHKRRKHICTHIAAVILSRKINKPITIYT